MADNDQHQERTEQPTQKRLEDARKRGQIPRSRELNMTAVMLAGAGALLGAGHFVAGGLVNTMHGGFSITREALFAPDAMQTALTGAALSTLKYAMPVLLATLAAALLAPLSIGGWNVSFQAVAPDWSKLSPVAGFKRIFGLNGWVELGKALAKVVVVGGFATAIAMWLMDDILALGRMDLREGIGGAARLACYALITMSAALVLVAAVDVPYQLWNYRDKLKMSRQEIRDEMKETDGRPEIKSRIRTVQQQLAKRRMMQAVPTADVIVVNPTHYAVALQYQPNRMRAPRVVAKGAGLVALAIRTLADQHRVPLFEAPPLARALYKSTDIGREIPAALYVAVAQVLTYIYQLKSLPAQAAAKLSKPQPQVDEAAFGISSVAEGAAE